MQLQPPFPTLTEMMDLMGEAGRRLAEIDASEGAAGNISVYVGWEIDPKSSFPLSETIPLPTPMPELNGKGFLVSGSGRRLREIKKAPKANLSFVRVEENGTVGRMFYAPSRLFQKPTSEFNSHLAVHRDQIARGDLNFHAIIHAQPLHLVYLSHISRYQDTSYLNRHILRWQPESIVNLPEGVGFIPFLLPGSDELMASNIEMLRSHRLVLWAKHGVMARSEVSVKKAGDLIEYAETGAKYECLNLTHHGLADGLSDEEVQAICSAFSVEQKIF